VEILTVRDLNFQYAMGRRPALHDVNFTVEKGDFVTICGATGSGKSTLLRMLKKELIPRGELTGEVIFDGTLLRELDDRRSAGAIGFVMQRPEQQLVTDKVWHELAFGLENLGCPKEIIRRKVTEMASYFGIENWFDRPVDDLSGGQKQLLNLAAIMVMNPELLILDEPTAQLDPVAATDFLETLGRLNRDTGITVILVEHRPEQAIPMGNRLMVLDRGTVLYYGAPKQVCSELQNEPELLESMPAAVRLCNELRKAEGCGGGPDTAGSASAESVAGHERSASAESVAGHERSASAESVAGHERSASAGGVASLAGNASAGGVAAAARVAHAGGESGEIAADCPLTVREGNRWIKAHYDNSIRELPRIPYILTGTPVLELKNLWFRYGRALPDVLRGTDLTVFDREIFCILGGNGSGKSTTLNSAAGLLKPYTGEIRIFGKNIRDYKGNTLYKDCLSVLPQDVQSVFLMNTVREELKDAGAVMESLPYDLAPYLDQHPYDLSGGQQQLVALAKVLATKPRLLLMDEPTKGVDAHSRRGLIRVLRELRDRGMTIVMVTHDVEFAAEIADRCAMFFRGEVTSVDVPRSFFAANHFYTTAINRMTRDYYDDCITLEDAVKICRANAVREQNDETARISGTEAKRESGTDRDRAPENCAWPGGQQP